MKKTNSNSHHILDDEGLKQFAENFHEFWDSSDDEIDRRELRHFIDDENQPKIRELNDSDVSVEDVLVIGSYLALNKLHNDFHQSEADNIKGKIEAMFNGKVELRQIAPGNMPEEVLQALEQIVELGRDMKKKTNRKPRGKK